MVANKKFLTLAAKKMYGLEKDCICPQERKITKFSDNAMPLALKSHKFEQRMSMVTQIGIDFSFT